MCDCPDTLTRSEARRLAGYLHTINALIVATRNDPLTQRQWNDLEKARELITTAMNPLMELRGQTDFYGNPTHSCDVRAQEERMLQS